MAVKYYEKTFEDIKLQYPPEEVIKKARPSEKSLGNDVLVTVERVEGACLAHQIEGMSWLYKGIMPETNEHVCTYSEYEYWPYVSGMSQGVTAQEMGIACDGEDGFVSCGAWGCPSCEAKIVYRLHPIPYEESMVDEIYEYLGRGGHNCIPKFFREKYSPEWAIQSREDLMREWDEAGRPLFWDKWRDENKLYWHQKGTVEAGIPDAKAIRDIMGRPTRLSDF